MNTHPARAPEALDSERDFRSALGALTVGVGQLDGSGRRCRAGPRLDADSPDASPVAPRGVGGSSGRRRGPRVSGAGAAPISQTTRFREVSPEPSGRRGAAAPACRLLAFRGGGVHGWPPLERRLLALCGAGLRTRREDRGGGEGARSASRLSRARCRDVPIRSCQAAPATRACGCRLAAAPVRSDASGSTRWKTRIPSRSNTSRQCRSSRIATSWTAAGSDAWRSW